MKTRTAIFFGFFCISLATEAIPLLDVDLVTGKLRGAKGVQIEQQIYDVAFRDGSCIELFDGCLNPQEDFSFSSLSDANLSTLALLELVLLDVPGLGNFDSTPALVSGCNHPPFCVIFTPYNVDGPQIDGTYFVLASSAANHANEALDALEGGGGASHLDFGQPGYEAVTWAVWTKRNDFPEPTTDSLLGLALATILRMSVNRNRQRKQSAVFSA